MVLLDFDALSLSLSLDLDVLVLPLFDFDFFFLFALVLVARRDLVVCLLSLFLAALRRDGRDVTVFVVVCRRPRFENAVGNVSDIG